MKKILLISLVSIVILALAAIYLFQMGFSAIKNENAEARKQPLSTVSQAISLYKSNESLDRELFYRFHSDEFENLVTTDQLIDYWENELKILPNTNVSTNLISENGNEAVIEIMNNNQNSSITVYLEKEASQDYRIWSITGYKSGESTLGTVD